MTDAEARAPVSDAANDEWGGLGRSAGDRLAEADGLRDYMLAVNAILDARKSGLIEFEARSGRILSANAHFRQMTGWATSDLMRRAHADILHPDDRSLVIDQWRKTADGGGPADLEARCLRSDGTIARVRLSMAVCARDKGGSATRGLAMAEDVTEARKETNRLYANEALLRVSMQTGQIGVFDIDLATGRISSASKTRALIGLPPEETSDSFKTWLSALMPEDRGRVKAQFSDAFANRMPEVSAQCRMFIATLGRVRQLEARASIEYDPCGRPIRVFGVLIDVTSAHEAEEMLRLCLQVGEIGAFRHDWDAGLVVCGPEAKAIMGLPANSAPIPRALWWSNILPEDLLNIQSRLQAAAVTKAVEDTARFRLRCPGAGALRHIEARYRHVYAPDGRLVVTTGVMIDVTATQQAEELRRLGMEMGGIGAFHHDFISGLVECSAETKAMFGFPPDGRTLTVEQWWAPILSEDLERIKVDIAEGIREGDRAVRNGAFRIRHIATGELRHFEVRARVEYSADGGPLSALGVVIDVTASRQAEDFQQMSLQIGGIGTFRHDFVTGLVDCSPETRAIYGFPSDGKPLTAERWWSPILPEEGARLRTRIEAWLTQKAEDLSIAFRARHLRDGGLRHLEARVRPQYDSDGRLLSALGVIIDVTNRQEAEARIAYAERARQRLEALGETVGAVAHEVNNLMQPITGLCELSLLDLPADAPDRQHWEIVADCARRVSSAMGNILAYGRYAKPEAACVPFGPAVVTALDFVCSVSLQWPQIVREIHDTRACAMIVEDELAQVLLNLIQNAVHAHAKRIIVSVALMDLGGDLAGASDAPAPSLRLTVADDGDGMDQDTCDRAFLPFFSSRPVGEGTGMGLPVVSSIVRSWSGQIAIESRPGAGTTMSIIVPVAQAHCAPHAA